MSLFEHTPPRSYFGDPKWVGMRPRPGQAVITAATAVLHGSHWGPRRAGAVVHFVTQAPLNSGFPQCQRVPTRVPGNPPGQQETDERSKTRSRLTANQPLDCIFILSRIVSFSLLVWVHYVSIHDYEYLQGQHSGRFCTINSL